MPLPWQRNANPPPAEPTRRRRDRRRQRPQAEEARRQSARQQEERRRQRLAITIGAMLILAIIAIVGVGYYREFWEPPRVMACEVRSEKYTMGDLVERLRVLQGINRYQGGFVDLSTRPFEFLQDLCNTEILRQAAPGLGITVTDEDIDQAIRDQFYPPDPPPGQETDPGQLEREFQNNYSNFLTQVRLSREDYRQLVEERLLRLGLVGYVGQDIPETMEQVEVEWIRLDPEGQVVPQEVRSRLDIEDFGAVAAEVGASAGFADNRGYVGWVPRGAFPRLDEVLFGNEEENTEPLAVGEISDPVFTREGVYIIRKISGPEDRELAEGLMRRKLNFQMVENWQSQQLSRGSNEGWLKINFNSDRYAWVADQVRVTAPRVDQPQRPPNQGGLSMPGR